MEPHCACIIDSNDDVVKLCAPHQDVVDAAVAAEREACAKLAEQWGQRQDQMSKTAFVPGAHFAEKFAADGIAGFIRNRQT
jgi:hypothetical protein